MLAVLLYLLLFTRTELLEALHLLGFLCLSEKVLGFPVDFNSAQLKLMGIIHCC